MKRPSHKDKLGYGNENIRVIEDRIHPEVYSEFYRYLEEDTENIDSDNTDDIKRELVLLARSGTIESYRKIEKMVEDHTFSEKDCEFATIALNFCRFRIENDLLDIPTDMISGGLGGISNKIRYYVALTGKEDLSEDNYKRIENIFNDVLSEYDSVLEQVKYHDFYISLLILGSIYHAIGDLLDTAIARCGFLAKDYYLTNVEIPTDERIRDWLDGKLDETL
jgi:hypothetical protein